MTASECHPAGDQVLEQIAGGFATLEVVSAREVEGQNWIALAVGQASAQTDRFPSLPCRQLQQFMSETVLLRAQRLSAEAGGSGGIGTGAAGGSS